MSNPGFIKLNEDYLEVQLSSKNLSNQTLLLRIGQLEEYLERVGEPTKFKIDLDFRDNPKVTDTDLEFDGFGRLVTFLKKFGSFVTRLRIGGTGISGSGLCELIDFIKMGAAEELDFSNLPGVEQFEVVALLMAVKESQQYPLQKSLPLLLRLDRNGLEKPHEIIAMVSQDLCCEVLTDPCELQKATVARNKVHRGEAEPTEVMISLPEFYLQSEEAVTTPVPKTPKSAPSTPEKKPLNLRAKAQAPPPPPPLMEEVKVEEEDLPVVGSLPKAFCGSRAKKASPVVSILPLANPKPPDHHPPAHVMWKNLSTSAKARKWMEVEIQKSVMTKASSRCDSKALAQGVPETMPISGIGVPPPNERPKPSKSMALASPMPPPLSPPPWSAWSRESSTPVIPAKPRPAQRRPEETPLTPGIPSVKSQLVQVLTQVAVGGKMISQAAQSDALRMLEKFGARSDGLPMPTSSEVRTLPSPQQKLASGSQEWNHSEGKEEWKDWNERKRGDWSGFPWRKQDQAWSEWDVKEEATWDAKKETIWDDKQESTWDVKQTSTWDVKQESAWGVKQESTWDVKQESTWDVKKESTWDVKETTSTWDPKKETVWDVKQETTWDVKKEGTWDVTKETTWDVKKKSTWDVKKETTWNVKQEITWDVKEWSWTGQSQDENSQAQSWKHTEVKAEEWKDWSDWKKDWQNWEPETLKTWPEEKERTRGWSDEKASEEQDSEWKERKSHHPPDGHAEEEPNVEKPSTEVELDMDQEDDEDEPSQRIGHFAEMLERWKEKKEQLRQDMKKSREELKQELSLQQDACRDNSEDPSDVETEAFPRVPAPSNAYEAYDSVYELVEEEELEEPEEPEAMDVDEVVKRSREILRRARGEVPQRGKRGRSPLPQEPPYPPPKKGRTGRRSSLRSGPRRKGKKGGVDDSKTCAVDIRNLLYSQKSCKDTFQCGRTVDQLVKDLETGKVDISAPFLRLTVFETRDEKSRKPELRCIDNRRLLALKEYARKIGNPKLKVYISLFSEETLTQVQRFFQNSDDTDGRDVRLRTSRNDKRRQLID